MNSIKFWFWVFLSLLSSSHEYFNPNRFYSTVIKKRNYVVVASRILRCRTLFGVTVHVFDDPESSYKFDNRSFQFHAVITANDNEIVSHKQILYWNSPQMVYVPTPFYLSPAVYELHVLGVDTNEMVIFDELSTLTYDSKFVSVIFQTTRPVYCAGQTVRFRILVLDTTLLPFNDIMDIFILDPDGLIMKRWLSLYTNNGVLSLQFKLPKLSKNGRWKIRSKIGDQIDEKSIIVQIYYQPLFEVIVSSPPFIAADEEKLSATVSGIFPSQKHVRGNATVSWFIKYNNNNNNNNNTKFNRIYSQDIFIKEKEYEVTLPFHDLPFEEISGTEVKITVQLTEVMSGESVFGFSNTKIINNKIVVKFLSKSPIFFTPGTLLQGKVVVQYEDGERIPSEVLENSVFKIQLISDASLSDEKFISEIEVKGSYDEKDFSNNEFYDMLMKNSMKQQYIENNVVSYHFDVPENAKYVELKAIYTNDGETIEEKVTVRKKYSLNERYVKIWTISEDLVVGDYGVFHAKTNFEVDAFYIIILSKGIVLRSRKLDVSSDNLPSVTFSEPLSSDMAPLFHLIIYCLSKENDILSDVVTVPVNGFNRYETTLEINTGKDFRAENVEVIASGGEGAFIGIQAIRSAVYHLQGGHELTRSRVIDSFINFEKNYKSVNKITWLSRSGNNPKESVYFTSRDYTSDSFAVFSLNNLVVISNRNLSDQCKKQNFPLSCIKEDCSNFCDKIIECIDEVGESGCSKTEENYEEYFLRRINLNSFIFDVEEGDWAFREIKKNDHLGIEFEILETPQTADDWYFSAFNMDMVYGFSMIEFPVVFSSKKPLMAHIIGPNQCHRGEQLGLKLYLHNFDSNRMLVTVTLFGSNDYKYVHVGSEGIVASYNAELLSGDQEVLIYMSPESEKEIHFPVAPTIEQGSIEIQFLVSSQAGRKHLIHTVNVFGEGALINRHTSVTLDLLNRGIVLQYLDIVVEETPIIPYKIWRRYIYGSPLANVVVSNDVIGPVISEGILNMNTLLKRESKGALDVILELYTNIWLMHYLRYTNQLKWEKMKEMLYECNSLYAEITRYFHKGGWFSHWESNLNSRPSVWLTAWALRVFKDASFPEWEFHLWIDPYIFLSMIRWLLTRQKSDGNFIETSNYKNPFDGRISQNNEKDDQIALTAHVVISLYSAMETVDGELKSNVVISCAIARVALEKALPSLNDPYLIAVIAYVFSITNSPEQNFAFTLLRKHERVNADGLRYWSSVPVATNPVKVENQRPYVGPRTYYETDSKAVETTSWVLLVYLAREGVTSFIENIVQWLMSMKMTNNGFVSITDTAVAYHALAEFALRSRILGITNIDVSIEMMATKMTKHQVHLQNESTSSYYLKVPYVWGHINIAGKGSGIAFVQLDVNYGIDDEQLVDTPRTNSFFLHIAEFYSYYRNKSSITIQSCLRYNGITRKTSGAVILEIQTPTGYHLLESDAIDVVNSNVHPTLKDARTVEGKTIWFFDFLDYKLNCFNHTIKRWYPVANMTLYRHALLYEITAREQFLQFLVNSTALYTLSICEVCGSYQCPYCQNFNVAIKSLLLSKNILILILFIIFIEYFLRI